jgi:hypothetical protein
MHISKQVGSNESVYQIRGHHEIAEPLGDERRSGPRHL